MDNNDKQYLEKMPYVTELSGLVGNIYNAINNGSSGEVQLGNLLSRLTPKLLEELKDDFFIIEEQLRYNIQEYINQNSIVRCASSPGIKTFQAYTIKNQLAIIQLHRFAVQACISKITAILDKNGLLLTPAYNISTNLLKPK